MAIEQARAIPQESTKVEKKNIAKRIVDSDVAKRLGISSTLSLALFGLHRVMETAAVTDGETAQHIKWLFENPSAALLVGSYAFNYTALSIESIYNMALLKNKHIKTSPNIISTSTSYLLETPLLRKTPKKIKKGVTFLSTLVPSGIEEGVYIPLAAHSEAGLITVSTRNLVMGAVNLVQSGAEQIVLFKAWRKNGKQKTVK